MKYCAPLPLRISTADAIASVRSCVSLSRPRSIAGFYSGGNRTAGNLGSDQFLDDVILGAWVMPDAWVGAGSFVIGHLSFVIGHWSLEIWVGVLLESRQGMRMRGGPWQS